MKTIRLALLSFATVLGSLVASAQQAPSEAFVSSVTGSATVITPGSTQGVPVVAGQKLPEGSSITTDAGGSVMIESHKGMQTGLGAKTTAVIGTHSVSVDGVRTAVIDLKNGTTVSVLDPAKRAVNNYAVRTPKGVAAARGTVYTTNVTLSSGGVATVTVNTMTGEVSFSIAGGATIAVTQGNSATNTSTASTPIASAMASATPAQKAELLEATKLAAFVVGVVSVNGGDSQLTAFRAVIDTVVADLRNRGDTTLASSLIGGLVDGITSSQSAVVVSSPGGEPQTISTTTPTGTNTPVQPIDITIVTPSSP